MKAIRREENPHPNVGSRPRLASIWAQDRAGLLGSGTGMLWHVPADFAHFKSSTMGCPIIMGRASWEALGGPLPGRPNIVITRQRNYEAPGALLAYSLEEAINEGIAWATEHDAHTVWITGGAQVYAEAMPLVEELVVSDLDLCVPLDPTAPAVHAPLIDERVWVVDPTRSDTQWREPSGDARWKVRTLVRRARPDASFS